MQKVYIGFWNQTSPILPAGFRRGKRGIGTPEPATQKVRSQRENAPTHDFDCRDFKTQAEAQRMLDSTPGDPYKLDRDSDRVACESLP